MSFLKSLLKVVGGKGSSQPVVTVNIFPLLCRYDCQVFVFSSVSLFLGYDEILKKNICVPRKCKYLLEY